MRVRVPALGVTAEVTPLGLVDSGAVEVPTDYAKVGWFRPGVTPGEVGAAVLIGHVDSAEGPAVFYGVSALSRRAQVLVDRADGTTVVFRVNEVAQYPKDAFPTAEVYASNSPTLRLITCGGDFDGDDDAYESNVVAFARLVDVRETSTAPD